MEKNYIAPEELQGKITTKKSMYMALAVDCKFFVTSSLSSTILVILFKVSITFYPAVNYKREVCMKPATLCLM